MYSGFGIAFDVADSWNFGDDFAWNVIIFGANNNSSSHNDNRTKIFSILGEGHDINGSFKLMILMEDLVTRKKSLVLVLEK